MVDSHPAMDPMINGLTLICAQIGVELYHKLYKHAITILAHARPLEPALLQALAICLSLAML